MKKIVIIVAGGSGTRMNSDIPKQFMLLAGKPIIMHTFKRFLEYDPDIEFRLVLPSYLYNSWTDLCEKYNFRISHKVFPGGLTRFHSVRSGLEGITGPSLVAVHDAVRPLVSIKTIENCYRLAEEKGSAIPVMPLTESIREIFADFSIARHREDYRSVQTPQVFRSDILLKAYEAEYTELFTDDASVVENAGYPVSLTDGNIENIKITNPVDLQISESLIKNFI